MDNRETVRYLKLDRGRYFYQRRVPKHLQRPLGITFWRRPCGDVEYPKAVQLVVTWAEEHDALIAELNDPGRLEVEANQAAKRAIEKRRTAYKELDLPEFYSMTEQRPGEKKYYPVEVLPRPWQAAAKIMADADDSRKGTPPHGTAIRMIEDRVRSFENGERIARVLPVPDYAPITEYIAKHVSPDVLQGAKIKITDAVQPLGDLDDLDWLNEAYRVGFGGNHMPPNDPDERDEYEFIKRKLERKISDLAPDPNTITAVAERYYTFNSIRPRTVSKYRRGLARLIDMTGDVPVNHLRTEHLRALRDSLMPKMKPASVHAVFTPIKGMLNYAAHEEIDLIPEIWTV
jgi:hypothetical protein